MNEFTRSYHESVRDYVTWATSDHPRIGTGFPFFDSRCGGGAAAGEMVLVQARSSVGKTTIANNIIVNNPEIPIVVFSLEMAGRYIANRLAAISQETSTKQIEYDLQTTGRSPHLQAAVEQFTNVTIVDRPGMSLKQMGEAIHEIEQDTQSKIQMAVIDFLELIGGVGSMSAVEGVDRASRKAKDFCREHDLVTFLLTQVGRGEGGAGEEPLSLSSARYGGEASADYVIGAYRPCLRKGITGEEYAIEKWQIYLQFLKSRGGSDLHPHGELHEFNPETMRIRPWQYVTQPLFPRLPEEIAA